MPTTGYQDIVLNYAVETSSSASGQRTDVFAYSLDSGITWQNAGMNLSSAFNGVTTSYGTGDTVNVEQFLTFGQVTVDMSGISGVNNNPKFVFRITWIGGNNEPESSASGNNRYDNISLTGLPFGQAAAVPVGQPGAVNPITGVVNITCNGVNNGTASATVTGGTAPYSYSWSTGATASTSKGFAISNLAPGTYTVSVNDANSCGQVTATAVITQPDAFTFGNISSTPASCSYNSDGTATVSVSGGTAPYNYSWTGKSGVLELAHTGNTGFFNSIQHCRGYLFCGGF